MAMTAVTAVTATRATTATSRGSAGRLPCETSRWWSKTGSSPPSSPARARPRAVHLRGLTLSGHYLRSAVAGRAEAPRA